MPMGSIDSYLKLEDNPDLSEDEIFHITRQILKGLQYLHLNRIIHRDIKGANVLLENKFTIKLTDFGISKVLKEISQAVTSYIGTTRWMAPEMFKPDPYSYGVDIWSVGCTVLQMITRSNPFNDLPEEQMVMFRLGGDNPSPAYCVKGKCSKNIQELLDVTLEKDPLRRPTANDLLKNFFLNKGPSYQKRISNLHKLFNVACENNSDHSGFIPSEDFRISHLPKGYQSNDIVEYVKAMTEMTVEVTIKMTSKYRPQFWPGTQQNFPSYDIRGCDDVRTGSAYVYSLEVNTSSDCQCKHCRRSDTPSKQWGEILVITSSSVLFDNIEGHHTKCRFFYSNFGARFFSYDELSVLEADVESDRCVIKLISCDMSFLDKIKAVLKNTEFCRSKLMQTYWSVEREHKLCIITSHPHGFPTHISIGHWIDRRVSGVERTAYTYTTSTCPGGAGAPVIIFSRLDFKRYHTHCGNNSEGIPCSGIFLG